MAYRQTALITCDRCREEMPHQSAWPQIEVRMTQIDGGSNLVLGLPRKADLCPGCAESLKVWWEWTEVR